MRYSPSTGCFYPTELAYESLPDDLIDVSLDDLHEALSRRSDEIVTVVDGRIVVAPRPFEAPTVAMYTAEIQGRLDAFARERGYDDMASLVTYAGDTDPLFAAEGDCGKKARSATWAAARTILADVTAGRRAIPTIGDLLAELPELKWPVIS